jgi:XTP/dITP diphosphohydrolase
MKLIIGTKNKGKLLQIKGSLSNLDIDVTGLPNIELPEVIEDGRTAQENGRKKALTYSKILNEVVFSMDNALYIDGLLEDDQPGINVRRIKGKTERPTDQELLFYYSKLIESLGGKARGYWEFAVCVADPSGEIKEITIISERIFTSKPSEAMVEGYPLESIQIDSLSGKYISEMNQKEQDDFWKRTIGKELEGFIKEVLNI